MTQYTEGPWKAVQYGDGSWVVTQKGEKPQDHICQCANFTPTIRDDGSNNARLIAAAPELLEALREIVQHDGTDQDYRDEWTEALAFRQCQDIAARAIAKAEA